MDVRGIVPGMNFSSIDFAQEDTKLQTANNISQDICSSSHSCSKVVYPFPIFPYPQWFSSIPSWVMNTWKFISTSETLPHLTKLIEEPLTGKFKKIVPVSHLESNVLVIADAELIAGILKQNRNDPASSIGAAGFSKILETIFGCNLVALEKNSHGLIRSHYKATANNQQFTSKVCLPLIDKTSNEYIQNWVKQKDVCIRDTLGTCLTQILAQTMIQTDLCSTDLDYKSIYQAIRNVNHAFRLYLFKVPYFYIEKELMIARQILRDAAQRVELNGEETLAAKVMTSKDKLSYEGRELTELQLQEIVAGTFLGGEEPVECLIEHILYRLGQQPEWQDDIINEYVEALSEKEFLKDNQTLLHRVMLEAMRMAPPAEITRRDASKDIYVNDYESNQSYFAPKGTVFILSFYHSGRNPQHWHSPGTFNPDRHLGRTANQKYNNFFGGTAANSCAGKELAILITKKFILNFILKASFTSESNPLKFNAGSALNIVDPVHLKVTSRKKSEIR